MKALFTALLGAAAVVAWFGAMMWIAFTVDVTLGFGFGGAVLSIFGWIAFWALLIAASLKPQG